MKFLPRILIDKNHELLEFNDLLMIQKMEKDLAIFFILTQIRSGKLEF